MNGIIIAGTIAALIGLVSGANGLRKLRSAMPGAAELSWNQDPLSPWKYETLTMVAITLHSISLVCLTALILLSVARSSLFTTFSLAIPFLLLSVAALFAALFTPYGTGVAVAYHFTQSWISPIAYGVHADGLYHGAILVPWRSFSHYEVGPEDGMISLYSGYSPRLRTWVLQPPRQLLGGVLERIRQHVPSARPDENSIPWQRSPSTLLVETALLAFIPLLPAVWGWMRNSSWVWLYALVAYFLVQYVGIKLFTTFDGRGGQMEESPTTA